MSVETVDQVLYEDMVSAKGGLRLENNFNRDISITFKLYEGYINYWIMHDIFRHYYDLDNKNKFLPDFNISFLDHTGFEFINVNLHQIIFTSLSSLELDYSSNSPDFSTFNCNFRYNYIKIKNRLQ